MHLAQTPGLSFVIRSVLDFNHLNVEKPFTSQKCLLMHVRFKLPPFTTRVWQKCGVGGMEDGCLCVFCYFLLSTKASTQGVSCKSRFAWTKIAILWSRSSREGWTQGYVGRPNPHWSPQRPWGWSLLCRDSWSAPFSAREDCRWDSTPGNPKVFGKLSLFLLFFGY